jgi:glutamine synthetase type III
MYNKNTVFIVGDARTQEDNPITFTYNKFFMAFVVEKETGVIIDAQCSSTLDITDRFLNGIFIGKNLMKDQESIEQEIDERYFGSSKKAIIVSLKDASKKYGSIK